jgi:Mce-associated membrane protein
VINDARTLPPAAVDAEVPTSDERATDVTVGKVAAGDPPRRRSSRRPVPVLSVLLVLLLAAGAFLWFTRDEPSAVTTDDYVEVLQAARSTVVDFTSFDHLTLDDDIEQVRRVAIGDLRDEAVEQLDSRRQEITDAEAVVNTEVIGAGVTRADAEDATVLLVIQTTRQTNASEQAQIVKYRIEVEMQQADGRWVLSRITGA